MTPKEKHKYFLKISKKREERILEAIEALGSCSNPASYLYDTEELEPIFSAIEEKLRETRARLESRSPYRHVPFRLSDQLSVANDRKEV